MWISLCVLAVAAVSALPLNGARHVLNFETTVPADWSVVGPAAKSAIIPFYVALTQENVNILSDIFESVSNPQSLQYGEYMSRSDILKLVAPTPARANRVSEYLSNMKCENMGDALRCEASVAAIETAFETSLMVVTHTPSGLHLIRQIGNLSIPVSLAADVQFLSPLSQFAAPHRRPRASPSNADFFIVPETLTRMYNISENGDVRSTQGVAEFGEGQWNFSFTDLQEFAQLTNKVIAFTKFTGPAGSPDDPMSLEATLDVQYIGAIGQGNTNWYWKETTWMFDFTANLQAATDRPAVLSLSYAWSEEQQCSSITDQAACTKLKLTNAQYVARINNEFMKIGLLGTSIVVASGDSGCHGRTDESCGIGPQGKKMHPDYPACSPYVTSVGGTALSGPVSQNPTEPICTGHGITCATGGSEITATTEKQVAEIVSGGGFSELAPRPAYQDAVVTAYLKNFAANLPPTSLFNESNRGFPDVSALSHAYYIQSGGSPSSVDGTSCAAPVWGGIIGLLNAHRLRLGRPLVGFANPLLYQVHAATSGAAFQDVTVGDNRCTESGCQCKYGFTAEKGWDAATGLGTPNVGRIIAAMDALDAAREARKAANMG